MPVKKRKAWIACVLSFIVPGLGQLYNGQWKKAILFYGINIVFTILSMRFLLDNFYGALGFIIFAAIFVIFICIEAVFQASESKEIVLTKYTRWYFYLLLWLINIGISHYLTSPLSSYQSYKIPAGSMQPSLVIGDRFIVKKTVGQHYSVERGDVIVFPFPDSPSRDFVKRVIGLPNEKIEIINKQVFINDQPLQEDYIQHNSNEILAGNPRDNFGPVIVPSDSVFMLGDNRDNSLDSRFWKNTFVKITTIQGKALYLYWSKDLSRIGQSVK